MFPKKMIKIDKTMIDKEDIIRTFIRNFIRKDKRKRAIFLLLNSKRRSKFIQKLNHQWDTILDMRHLRRIDNSYNFVYEARKLSKFEDGDLCYVISDSDSDDKILLFRQAFNELEYMGFAWIIMNISADTILFQAEAVKGGTPRYVGQNNAIIEDDED